MRHSGRPAHPLSHSAGSAPVTRDFITVYLLFLRFVAETSAEGCKAQ